MVNYRPPKKFLGLLAPTQSARVTRLSPTFHVTTLCSFPIEYHLAHSHLVINLAQLIT